MVMYDTVRRTCEEQRKIVDEAMDRTVLSSVFKRLPRLTEVGILFRTVKGQKWLELYPCFPQMTMGTKSWEHHIRVVSHAISIAKYKLLLANNGVDSNSKDDRGWTPLSSAAWGGHEAVVTLLLDTDGVDVDIKDNKGRTPLFLAAENGMRR
jgi:hypothetical protein